jgi:hypothetical protein
VAIAFTPVHIKPTSARVALGAERVIAEVVVSNDVRVRALEGADANPVTALVRALSGAVSC